jgi:hypothetical protein
MERASAHRLFKFLEKPGNDGRGISIKDNYSLPHSNVSLPIRLITTSTITHYLVPRRLPITPDFDFDHLSTFHLYFISHPLYVHI